MKISLLIIFTLCYEKGSMECIVSCIQIYYPIKVCKVDITLLAQLIQ